ncbi:FAD-binding protein [Spartinivicinus poritis]|uniref:FAD-binding protein n=1 Tax=Spartinivicinus poritis TaxID=2994640 RepID=A0ABT5U7L8_9GAMM|nr:FAD-binding protein [Spartinivicinus sp. A2-2]MDE1461502.1 FAD-binding protein [Spartinivicinus sp. A2-2]
MKKKLSRRETIKGVLTAGIIIGFNLQTRSWATTDTLLDHQYHFLANDFPDFEGELLTDNDSLQKAADDFGHIIHLIPRAVLKPASVQDIVKMVRFAMVHQINVTARGQGFSTAGEAQVNAGVVIDMSSLTTVKEITDTSVLVEAGTNWFNLLNHTLPHQLTLPIVTDFLELTVGGTLSVGGLGAQSYQFGTMADNVLQLTAVTGKGELITCSPTHYSSLFHALRSGLGQFGIIVEARMKLTSAPSQVRFYQLYYDDLSLFLSDNKQLLKDKRFSAVQGGAEPNNNGGWKFSLQATKYFEPGSEPDNAQQLNGLNYNIGTEVIQDMPFFAYLNRLAPIVEQLKKIGVWYYPHPWCPLLIPDNQAEPVISDILSNLNPNDMGGGPILFSGYSCEPFNTPLFKIPKDHYFFYFSLMRNAIPPTIEQAEALMQINKAIYEQVVAAGGFQYPVGAIPMTRQDWRRHYRRKWRMVKTLKYRFDPKKILGSSRTIFD